MKAYELAVVWSNEDIVDFLNNGWEPFQYSKGSFFFKRPVDIIDGEQISVITERPLLCGKTKIQCQLDDEARLSELDDLRDENMEYEAKKLEAKRIAALRYSFECDATVDDHTSVWGRMGGPDCCTQPVMAGH